MIPSTYFEKLSKVTSVIKVFSLSAFLFLFFFLLISSTFWTLQMRINNYGICQLASDLTSEKYKKVFAEKFIFLRPVRCYLKRKLSKWKYTRVKRVYVLMFCGNIFLIFFLSCSFSSHLYICRTSKAKYYNLQ